MTLAECSASGCEAPIAPNRLYCVKHGGQGPCLHKFLWCANADNMERYVPGFAATVSNHASGYFYDYCRCCDTIIREYEAFAALPFEDEATPHEVAMANRSKAFGVKYRMKGKLKTVAA